MEYHLQGEHNSKRIFSTLQLFPQNPRLKQRTGKTQAKQLKNTSFFGIVGHNMIMDSNHEVSDFQTEDHSLIRHRVHSVHVPYQANQENKLG